MRIKLWPKAGDLSHNFQLYFIHINFFKKPNKKICNRAKEILRCYYICFLIFYCLLAQKKCQLKNGQTLTLPYIFSVGNGVARLCIRFPFLVSQSMIDKRIKLNSSTICDEFILWWDTFHLQKYGWCYVAIENVALNENGNWKGVIIIPPVAAIIGTGSYHHLGTPPWKRSDGIRAEEEYVEKANKKNTTQK